MIIRYPTGLYRNVLPREPADRGNVTYTVSMTAPPRADLTFAQLPVGVQRRERPAPPRVRQDAGELLFSISQARRAATGNNARQYEIGQVLDFQSGTGPVLAPMLVAPVTETRHDLGVVDAVDLGLSAHEQQLVAQQSLQAQRALTTQLNLQKQSRADAEQQLSVLQRSLNDTARTLQALEVVQAQTGDGEVAALIARLRERVAGLTAQRETVLAQAQAAADQAAVVAAQLRALVAVVK